MIAAVVLAAGESRRMGTQKLLLPLGGMPVIVRVVEQVVQSSVDETIVVTGHDSDAVSERLAGLDVRCVHNPDYREGMLTSVRCGVRAAGDDTRAFVVVLGDQPRIRAGYVDKVVEAFDTEEGICVASYEGRRGHPMLFSAKYRVEVLTMYDAKGLRGLLEAHAGAVKLVPTENDDVLSDMDFPEDYLKELAKHGKGR